MPRVWKFGDSVNTDDILPGKFAPFMAGEDVFQTFAFHYIRPEFAAAVRPGDVLVGGRNWGLGSSREYAPQALKKLRVGGIIAPSFARIHYRNLLNLGIPAFEADLTKVLQDGDEVSLDVETGVLTRGVDTFQLPPPPDFLREALREGSILAFFKKYGRFPGEQPGEQSAQGDP
ncbi:homoaconitase small subunit [Deinococcus carri]|uniref:3-isopropylmalate dehydratase small subunit n=1 Tax=Deinococcus carri TaxID=1211323 RepID=A0ABP9W465_9DEIO